MGKGILSRLSTTLPARAQAGDDPFQKNYRGYFPPAWAAQFGEAGISVTPELALTLSAMYMGICMIAGDIATMPCQIFRRLTNPDGSDGGRRRASNHPLSYVVRWAPNSIQSAKEFWMMMIGHFLLRGNAYAEIVPGLRGFADQLRPLHPDWVTPEVTDDWQLRYIIRQPGRPPRVLLQAEVFVLRDFSSNPVSGMSRIAYGMRSLSTAITQERFTNAFYRKGATGGLVATVKGGELSEEDAADMHANISRYIAGAQNAGGLLVIEDDVDIKNISLDLEKAQLVELKAAGIHDVERWLLLPSGRLGGQDQTHADSAVQAGNLQYYTSTLRPILVGVEQAIQRDLILAKDTFVSEFDMDALLRADLKTRYESYKLGIESRMLWPSEARSLERLNPDEELDQLAAGDRRPGASGGGAVAASQPTDLRLQLFVHDTAKRVIRKEVAAVKAMTQRHAGDPQALATALATFYSEHAPFVAESMRLPTSVAAAYAHQHRDTVLADGLSATTDWERCDADELAALAISHKEAA